jgi:IclR family transcriptional regulator, pca regulon regulatory protein
VSRIDEADPAPGAADPNFMLSLARGLDVLRAFEGHSSMSVADISRVTGLTRASAGRCLYTLVRLGYAREKAGRYFLTPGLLPLACSYLTSTPLASHSQAIANGLRDRLQETVSVGALDPADLGRLIYIARAERQQVIAAPLMVGSTLPSHCTSMGRVLLAARGALPRNTWLDGAVLEARTDHTVVDKDRLRQILDQVAEQRWSLVEEELEVGLRSLAVPIRERDGGIVAALNIATFSHAHSRTELMEKYLPELRAAAGQLERAL